MSKVMTIFQCVIPSGTQKGYTWGKKILWILPKKLYPKMCDRKSC